MLMVQKFGGTSLADAERIRVAAGRCVELAKKGWQVVAVVSAQGDTTDEMLEKAIVQCLKPYPYPLQILNYTPFLN